MGNRLNKSKRCSEKSDHIKKGNCIYSTGLLKWIVYSRAVYATRISNAQERAPFEFTYSWRRYFPPFITHRCMFCSSLQEDAGRQLKRKKDRRDQNKSCRSITLHFLLLGHVLSLLPLLPAQAFSSSCVGAIFLPSSLPSPLAGNFCYLWSFPVFPRERLMPQLLMMTAYAQQKHPSCLPHAVSDTQQKHLCRK